MMCRGGIPPAPVNATYAPCASVQTAKQWVERETAALEALQRDARAVEAATAASAASRRADLERAARDVTADRAALERRETDLRCRLMIPACSACLVTASMTTHAERVKWQHRRLRIPHQPQF